MPESAKKAGLTPTWSERELPVGRSSKTGLRGDCQRRLIAPKWCGAIQNASHFLTRTKARSAPIERVVLLGKSLDNPFNFNPLRQIFHVSDHQEHRAHPGVPPLIWI
jgi:hypothetical protein